MVLFSACPLMLVAVFDCSHSNEAEVISHRSFAVDLPLTSGFFSDLLVTFVSSFEMVFLEK